MGNRRRQKGKRGGGSGRCCLSDRPVGRPYRIHVRRVSQSRPAVRPRVAAAPPVAAAGGSGPAVGDAGAAAGAVRRDRRVRVRHRRGPRPPAGGRLPRRPARRAGGDRRGQPVAVRGPAAGPRLGPRQRRGGAGIHPARGPHRLHPLQPEGVGRRPAGGDADHRGQPARPPGGRRGDAPLELPAAGRGGLVRAAGAAEAPAGAAGGPGDAARPARDSAPRRAGGLPGGVGREGVAGGVDEPGGAVQPHAGGGQLRVQLPEPRPRGAGADHRRRGADADGAGVGEAAELLVRAGHQDDAPQRGAAVVRGPRPARPAERHDGLHAAQAGPRGLAGDRRGIAASRCGRVGDRCGVAHDRSRLGGGGSRRRRDSTRRDRVGGAVPGRDGAGRGGLVRPPARVDGRAGRRPPGAAPRLPRRRGADALVQARADRGVRGGHDAGAGDHPRRVGHAGVHRRGDRRPRPDRAGGEQLGDGLVADRRVFARRPVRPDGRVGGGAGAGDPADAAVRAVDAGAGPRDLRAAAADGAVRGGGAAGAGEAGRGARLHGAGRHPGRGVHVQRLPVPGAERDRPDHRGPRPGAGVRRGADDRRARAGRRGRPQRRRRPAGGRVGGPAGRGGRRADRRGGGGRAGGPGGSGGLAAPGAAGAGPVRPRRPRRVPQVHRVVPHAQREGPRPRPAVGRLHRPGRLRRLGHVRALPVPAGPRLRHAPGPRQLRGRGRPDRPPRPRDGAGGRPRRLDRPGQGAARRRRRAAQGPRPLARPAAAGRRRPDRPAPCWRPCRRGSGTGWRPSGRRGRWT